MSGDTGSRQAATQALKNSDITSIIFRCLCPGSLAEAEADERAKYRRRIAQKTLARAARTCRAFKSPALDVLWRSVDAIVHLLSVLPSFLPTSPWHPNDYTFHGRITNEEWMRFQEYAIRVRELRVKGNTFTMSHSEWSVLSQHCPEGVALVPRCERLLKLLITSPLNFAPFAVLWRSPNLRHLELEVIVGKSAPHETIQTLVSELTPVVDRLETLSLYVLWNVRNRQADRTIPFWEYSHLQSLTVKPDVRITRSIIQSLMHFPNLRSLEIGFTESEVGYWQPLEIGFHQLKDLSLAGVADQVHMVMQAASPPCLETLSIRFVDVRPPSSEHMMETVQGIYGTLPPSLREMHLTFENGFIPAEYILFPTATGILASLRDRNLRALTFHFHNHFAYLLGHELQAIVGTWPELAAFEFTYSQDILDRLAYEKVSLASVSTPTISTVAAFAAAHPHLERLALPLLDVRAAPLSPPMCELDVQQHPLQAFAVAYLEANVPLCPAALALDRLFPSLDMSEGAEVEPYSKLQLLLLGMQTMRLSTPHTLHPEKCRDTVR
ncbi:hypothetical protein C8T65DRAFT_742878 [Cerioporus squamosus]|nr:hypothetical protein C8T65DRAFT_742878 [Cerioporus squamosus]